jgi:propanol-preferring alcohol dehydrogenase
VFNPQGATIAELHEVVALAQTGRVTVEVEQFAFDDVEEAYRRLREGSLAGRAVVLPSA